MSNDTQNAVAIMLAGGRGSRLYELTETTCKPAVSVAGGRRIVDWTMENLSRFAPARVMVATQYQPEALLEHIQTSWQPHFGQGSVAIRDGAKVCGRAAGYLGTADAVTQNLAEIDAIAPQTVLVVAADHIYSMDYGAMIRAHKAAGRPVTVAVDRAPLAQARGFGVMATDMRGLVTEFAEKPNRPKAMPDDPNRALVSMGIYVFDWAWLRAALIADQVTAGSSHDFGQDILPKAVIRGEVFAYDVASVEAGFFWRDVGTLDALRQTCLDITSGKLPCTHPAYAFQPRAGIRVLPGRNVILPGGRVSAGARLRNVIVAPGAEVPADMVVGLNPVEDARHFRVTPEGTVLITAQMIARKQARLGAARTAPPASVIRAANISRLEA